MKKMLLTVVALAALTLMAAPHSSYAQDDVMGMYFADGSSCTTAAFLDHVTATIVYLNPTLTKTRGFECGIVMENATNTSITVTYPAPATDVGAPNIGGNNYNYITGYATPQDVPVNGDGFVLATLDIFVLDSGTINFTLRPASPSSDLNEELPMVMLDDFSLMTTIVAQATGSVTMTLNPAGDCGVVLPTEDMSFGGVKSLFR